MALSSLGINTKSYNDLGHPFPHSPTPLGLCSDVGQRV